MNAITTPTTATAKTPRPILNAAKRILKYEHPRMPGVFAEDGRFCLSDGCRAVRLSADIPELPHCDTDFSLAPVFQDATSGISDENLLPLPSVAELRVFIANAKADAKANRKVGLKPYEWPDGRCANPQYLLDMLALLHGCVAYRPDTLVAPIYFHADSGDGILMPVRPKPTPEELEARRQREKEDEERLAAFREREKERCRTENETSEALLSAAVDALRKGGDIKNQSVRFYDTDFLSSVHYTEAPLMLRLFQRYDISVPPRTKGWIDRTLASVKIAPDGLSFTPSVWRRYDGRPASQTFAGLLFQLIRAVRSGDGADA